MKIIFHANTNQKVSVLDLIADKIDTNARSITRNKQNHYTVIKFQLTWKIQQFYTCVTLKNITSKYIKQTRGNN